MNQDADPAIDLLILDDIRGWRLVRLGLRLTQFGVFAAVSTFVPASIQAGSILAGRPILGDMEEIVGFAFLGLFLASVSMVFTGRTFCCAVPQATDARGHGVRSVVCMATLPLACGVWFFWSWITRDAEPHIGSLASRGWDKFYFLGVWVVFAIYVIGHLSFVLFCRAVARYLKKETIAAEATGYCACYGILVAGFTAMRCLSTVLPNAGNLGGLLGFFLAIGSLTAFFWYLFLIGKVHDMVAEAMRKVGA